MLPSAEVGELCAFLASDKSSYITGAFVEITGGLYNTIIVRQYALKWHVLPPIVGGAVWTLQKACIRCLSSVLPSLQDTIIYALTLNSCLCRWYLLICYTCVLSDCRQLLVYPCLKAYSMHCHFWKSGGHVITVTVSVASSPGSFPAFHCCIFSPFFTCSVKEQWRSVEMRL